MKQLLSLDAISLIELIILVGLITFTSLIVLFSGLINSLLFMGILTGFLFIGRGLVKPSEKRKKIIKMFEFLDAFN